MEYQSHQIEETQINVSNEVMASYMTRVFGWMTLALTITAITALLVASSPVLMNLILGNRIVFFGLIIGQLIMVGSMVGLVSKMNPLVATLTFLAYSMLNGLTLSFIFFAYTQGSIALAFFITAGTFAFMSAYGYFTNKDLTSMGSFLFMGLIGVIIASVVNLFLQNSALYWIISYAGVFIFIGLTAYDTQKIKNQAMLYIHDESMMKKSAIMGALTLYLDFINLFIYILRIMGNRR